MMAEAGQRLQSGEGDPDFEPFCRPRSCTWPLRRPELGEPGGSPPPEVGPDKRELDFMGGLSLGLLEEAEVEEKHELQQVRQVQPRDQVQLQVHAQEQVQPLSSSSSTASSASSSSSSASTAQRKSSSCRRNAWGNMSYADLITQAIESSPDRRLTLAQIYEWMVKSVPYFKDKGDSNSSAGWKNSIRHNLSLHSRFIRVQNEGTGKSSWWMLNPDGGKNGKSPRRRAASMDNNSKYNKSRGRAAKKKMAMQGGLDGVSNSPGYSKWHGSPNSHSNDDFEPWNSFRTRTSSDASTLSGRRSPFLPEEEVGEGDIHMVYQTPKLPSLSEVSSSFNGKNVMMENLLDNLKLLSPKTGSQEAAHAQYAPYGSGQDFHKWQGGMNMPTPENKAGSYSPFPGQFNCSTGLLKELLSNEAEQRGDLVHPVEGVEHRRGARGRVLSPYGAQLQVKAPGPHTHSSTSVGINGCALLPPGHSGHHGNVKPYSHLPHLGGGAVDPAAPSYCMVSMNGYHRPSPAVPQHHHHHHHREHQHYHTPLERLPSDLDDMAIERLECDVESVLHDALMDGDALDFNFDQQGFSHSAVKNATHNWVTG